MWVRFNDSSGEQTILDRDATSGYSILKRASGNFQFQIGGSAVINETWSPATNTWYHIAIVRSGTNLRAFLDGTQLGSTVTNSTDIQGASGIGLGKYSSGGGGAFNGWMDELRVIKGTAIWTSNFTPPSSAYTDCSAVSSSQSGQQGVSGTLNFY